MKRYREVIITLIGFVLLVGSRVVACFDESVWIGVVGIVGACLMLVANLMAAKKMREMKKEKEKNGNS